MNFVIFGPQGSGKGTQAKLLSEKFGIPHISTGEIFRKAMASDSMLGLEAKKYVDQGKLVPDNIVNALVNDELTLPKAEKGFILDGFPRNVAQYQSLRDFLKANYRDDLKYIYIELTEEEAIARIAQRFICADCEEIYIGKPGICKKCGGKNLIQRTDETPEAVHRRLQLFMSETMPLVEEIEKDGNLIRVDGKPSIQDVHEEILKKLELPVK